MAVTFWNRETLAVMLADKRVDLNVRNKEGKSLEDVVGLQLDSSSMYYDDRVANEVPKGAIDTIQKHILNELRTERKRREKRAATKNAKKKQEENSTESKGRKTDPKGAETLEPETEKKSSDSYENQLLYCD